MVKRITSTVNISLKNGPNVKTYDSAEWQCGKLGSWLNPVSLSRSWFCLHLRLPDSIIENIVMRIASWRKAHFLSSASNASIYRCVSRLQHSWGAINQSRLVIGRYKIIGSQNILKRILCRHFEKSLPSSPQFLLHISSRIKRHPIIDSLHLPECWLSVEWNFVHRDFLGS